MIVKKLTKAVSDYCGDDNDYEIIDNGSYQLVMMVTMMTLMVMMFMKVLKVLTKAGSDDINATGCQSTARQNFPTKANNSIEVNFLLFIIIRKCANAANNSICQFLLQTSHCLLFRQHSREKDCHLSKKTFFIFQFSNQSLPMYDEKSLEVLLRVLIHNLFLSYFRKCCFLKVWQLLPSLLSLS